MMGRGAFGCQRLLARAETRLIADKLSADSYYGIVVISKLTRKTAIADAEEWSKRAGRFLERARPFLERQPGLAGIDLERDGGQLLETTRWQSMDDCRRYVRDGAAATVATMADAALPTAPYPNGAWTRENIEA